jgi:acyl-CoA thioesterase I
MFSQLLKSELKLLWPLAFSVIVTLLVSFSVNAAIKQPVQKIKDPAQKVILVFGDSLSAGYGLQPNEGWVALLQNNILKQDIDDAYTVVNASISGETTSGGLARFANALNTHKPNIVIIELGANDGLRGLPLGEMQENLGQMVAQAKAKHVKVLLIGMKIPPNYGLKYSKNFSAVYHNLAKLHKVALVPFLLEGIAGKPELIQADGLHPLAVAQPKLLENVWSTLEKMLV